MRLVRTAGIVLGAIAMVGGLVSPAAAKPLEVTWRDDAALPGYGQAFATDRVSGDVLALLQSGDGREVLRRLDGLTGRVEWTVPAPGMSKVAVDPSTGQVVLAGSRATGQVLMLVSSTGAVTRVAETAVTASVFELAVDTATGQVCTLGSQGRRTERSWVTACWTTSGDAVFADAWQPPAGTSQPSALAVDPRSHRVYAAGTSRPSAGRQKRVVLLAYDSSGGLRWSRARRGAVMPGYLDIAVDPDRGRIHLVNRPGFIRSPVQLFSFDSRGRLRFSRSWEDLSSVYTTDVEVMPDGRVLVVASVGWKASLRAYGPSGRLVRSTVVRLVRDRRDNFLDEIAIDPRRERVHLLVGGGDLPAVVDTRRFTGKRLSRVSVDSRGGIFGGIAVDPASGRVFAGTTLAEEAGQRVTGLAP